MLSSLFSCAPSLLPPTDEIPFSSEEAVTAELGMPTLPQGFSAGFARRVLNPRVGTVLGGYSGAENRKSRTIRDDIMLTCVAVCDGENTLLFYSGDYLGFSETVWNQVAKSVTRELGIPKENVLMNATHSHTAPAIHLSSTLAGIGSYLQEFYPAALQLAFEAMHDLEAATLYAGKTRTDGLNYVRRYLYADGSYAGNWPAIQGADKIRHETEPDETLQILKFDRETKKDIVLANWQCHPTAAGSATGTMVSADWIGSFRETVEKKLGVLCSFHQGAAGTIVSYSKIEGEITDRDFSARGKAVAETLIGAMDSLIPIKSGKVKASLHQYTATYSEAYRTENRLSATETDLTVTVLSIGEAAFATAPFEMADTNGVFVKENSPYKMTFICAYTNGRYGYIPALHSFPNGGYEVESCRFVPGTGEEIASLLLCALQDLQAS
ncbi:MAG: neutral/alkaline non-lysosomal ceramidase N-terminal domain-containing protein [Clostridia bacterium]|nr:neutral/alkaline non-lysosomal ceramidase N-terminal domain-containing protein [Clostridia bacterium]